MSRKVFLSFTLRGLLLAAFLGASTLLTAGDKQIQKRRPPAADQVAVEMFKAIADGQIAVKLIPKDATQCRVRIENKTDKPLSVKLPDSFVGVPILAQFGPQQPGGNRGSNRGGTSGSGNQAFGGGMGGYPGGGGGGGGMMGGMGMFNLPPEKVGQLEIPIVCLEHGKKNPKPAIPYEIRPVESFTQKSGVKELLQIFGAGYLNQGASHLNQQAVQAAAWHLNNDLSWQELACKRIYYPGGSVRGPYFSPQEIQIGMNLAATARKAAQENKDQEKTSRPGNSLYPQ
jgi:hypothetical protein